MITALVQIKLPQPMAKDKAKDVFAGTAPKYREVKGLIRKYYLLSEDGATAGGVYLWISREAAERLYTDVEIGSGGKSEINLNFEIRKGLKARGSVDSKGDTGIGVFWERDY